MSQGLVHEGVEWGNECLFTTKNELGLVFLLGSKTYVDVNGGSVAVFFTPRQAFLFNDADDEVLWSAEEFKNAYVEGTFKTGDFPVAFNEYIEICTADNEDGVDSVTDVYEDEVDEWGINTDEIMEDIKARMVSLRKFRVEKDMME